MNTLRRKKSAEAPCQKQIAPFRVVSFTMRADLFARLMDITLFLILFFKTALSATTINIPADYTTIQAGIDASTNGDTVLVQPGTYIENINFNGKNIVVGSLTLTTGDTSYISQTAIDGNQNGSVVTFENGEDTTATINGFTLTNGSGTERWSFEGNTNHAGGILAVNSSPKIINNTIIDNNSGIGGGIAIDNSSYFIITNNTISYDSTIHHGAGIITLNNSSGTISNNLFSNNYNQGGYGGAIQCDGSGLIQITGNIFTENVGRVVSWYGPNMEISGNTFQNNFGIDVAMDGQDNTTVNFENNVISNSRGFDVSGLGGELIIKNNNIHNNQYGVNIYSDQVNVTFIENNIYDNSGYDVQNSTSNQLENPKQLLGSYNHHRNERRWKPQKHFHYIRLL